MTLNQATKSTALMQVLYESNLTGLRQSHGTSRTDVGATAIVGERAMLNQEVTKRAYIAAPESIETGERGVCQLAVDRKALTGKGVARALNQVQKQIDSFEKQMVELSEASKKVPGAQIYLMVHRRHRTGLVFLRWRQSVGLNRKHLRWEQARAAYELYPEPIRSWYVTANRQAEALNEAHREARLNQRQIRAQMEQKSYSVLPLGFYAAGNP